MALHVSLEKRKKRDSSSGRVDTKFAKWVDRLWITGFIGLFLYFVVVYILPLFKISTTPVIPFKTIFEVIICLIPISSGILSSRLRIEQTNLTISTEKNMLLINRNNQTIGLCCLEIVSTVGSIRVDDSGIPKYNTSMLLAMRSGMDKSVNMAYEAGVSNGEPFLRIFVSTIDSDSSIVHERIRREATRAEAILLSSLNKIDLRILEGNDLERAATLFMNNSEYEVSDVFRKPIHDSILITLRGKPRVNPSLDTSQIGTFLSTALKQDYSVSMTCVFSAAKPGRERKKLEGKWKTIQSKEKRKEETLKDHAMKKQLVTQYEEIQDDVGWFDSTVYFVIKKEQHIDNDVANEGVRGLIESIWGGYDSIRLDTRKITKNTALKLLTRSHLRKHRVHVSRLVSFVNTPVRKLPVISPEIVPVFQIPSREALGKDILIGDTIFEGKPFSSAGLNIEWLREHVAILGATGTGKTTLVKHLIAQLSDKTNTPWWIFDVKGSEYGDLARNTEREITVLRPGLDKSFIISLMDSSTGNPEGSAYSTFIMLRELLKERGDSSELSPAMERLLRESIMHLASSLNENNSVQVLSETITSLASNDRMGTMTRDALLNRLQILFQEPLSDILCGGLKAIDISSLLDKRIILDLSYVARIGGMESARILYNLIAKRIFEGSMKRGIVPGLHHVVVLEEANNLVPESYSKHSSADVTTGESMVLLQRATGQGVIVVSTRPNISANILANTATKIVFRLPYDSQIGARFLSLNEEQEIYLRNIKCGRALVSVPNTETFEVATKLFIEPPIMETPTSSEINMEEEVQEEPFLVQSVVVTEEEKETTENEGPIEKSETQTVIFDRVGRFGNHLVASLAKAGMSTEQDIRELLTALDPNVMEDDISEVIRELVAMGTIEREALSLVPGGFVYTLPDNGLEAIRKVIVGYILDKLGMDSDETTGNKDQPDWPDLIIEEKAVVILPQHLRASSMESTMTKIRHYMKMLRNGISELFVVVRGSVAAAKLRELLDKYEEFDDVRVVSAFPSSLDSMIENLNRGPIQEEEKIEVNDDAEIIGAMHEIGTATSRAIQIRLWFGLIQDFVDLSNGKIKWEVLLEFIETTAMQSHKGRSAPLTVDEGRRALTELLADEVLIALRSNDESEFIELEQGLWIVNSSVLKQLKEVATNIIEQELRKHHSEVSRNHGYYDLCANNTSYVIFPNQQQLSTLLNLHSDVACRTCKSSKVVCILTASEYLEDSVVTPGNLIIKTMDDSVSALVT